MEDTRYAKAKIYRLVNNIDNEFYVGSTCNTLSKRLYRHKTSSNLKPNRLVYRHFNKIGWENVSIVLIEECPCKNKMELLRKERQCIETLQPNLNKQVPTRTKQEYYKQNIDTINKKHKEYYENNKDAIIETAKRRYEKNKDVISEKDKQRYEKNKGIILEKHKQYREKNKDVIAEKRKQYYEKNNDVILEKKKQYYEENKEAITTKARERRALKKQQKQANV
jgi:group I intron endonuclease